MEEIQTLLKNSFSQKINSEGLCRVDWSFIHSHLNHMQNWQNEWNKIFSNETYHQIKVLNIQESILILGVDNPSLKNILHFEEKNILSKIIYSETFNDIKHLKVIIIQTVKKKSPNAASQNFQKISSASKQILLESAKDMNNSKLAQSIFKLLREIP